MFIKHKIRLSLLLALCPLAWITSCTIIDDQAVATSKLTNGFITSEKITEASGFAVSHLNQGIIWVNNDSGNSASIYAINYQGQYLATLNIVGVRNNDWEDLATFNYQGDNYLLVADTGDNNSDRSSYQLHIIKEPKLNLTATHKKITLTAKPQWTIRFKYKDKSRDCESVAVDTVNQQILLLSKREFPHQLFSLPLKPTKNNHRVIAHPLGNIPAFPAPLKSRLGIVDIMHYSNMPTAMDISADNSMIAVLTYSSAYLYFKNKNDSWLQAFSSKPQRIDFPTLKQGEALAFDPSASHLYISSERTPAPVLKIKVDKYK